jgi:endonuclease/exonuclease/phosphatase (EEP) superfamily protein YafD
LSVFKKKCLLVSTIMVLVLAGITLGFALHGPGSDMTRDVRVMTCNIGDIMGGNPLDSGQVAAYLQSLGVPDVLLLQEVRGKKEAAFLSERLALPHFSFLKYSGKEGMGIAILSAFPLKNRHEMYFESSRKGAGILAVEVCIGQVPLLIVNLHLDRFEPLDLTDDRVPINVKTILGFLKKELMEESVRSRSVMELMAWLDKKNPDHVVLGGDFNTIPFSRTVRQLSPRFDDVLWPSLDYFKGTYTKLDFPIAPRIDFLFVSAGLGRKNARVIQKSPGDHFPVRADVLVPVRSEG